MIEVAAKLPPTPRYKLFAETVEELASFCGEHAERAVAAARWGAIKRWIMWLPVDRPESVLSCTIPEAHDALSKTICLDNAARDYPHHSGVCWLSLIPPMSAEDERKSRAVAASVVADWKRAGSPLLSPAEIKTIQQLLQSSLAAAKRKMGDRDGADGDQIGTAPTDGPKRPLNAPWSPLTAAVAVAHPISS